MEESKRIVEINGVKVEVDLREATTVDSFKVGDAVKVLVESYGDKYNSFFGVIAGFDAFKKRPTIIVAYLEVSYNETKLTFAHINQGTKDIEICATRDEDITIDKGEVLAQFQNAIDKKAEEIKDIERKRAYFVGHFAKYFDKEEHPIED